MLLAIVCIEDLECDQMDVETAFLNGEMEEEVFMYQPPGMVTKGNENWVLCLRRSLHGLK